MAKTICFMLGISGEKSLGLGLMFLIVFDINETVNRVVGVLISDSRNVYDRLQTEELSTQG